MRVVVINEQKGERAAMVRALQGAALRVEQVLDAKSAALAIAREPAQVIVIALPKAGAADLVRLVCREHASASAYVLVVLPPDSKAGDLARYFAAGAHDFLTRPVVDEQLVARVWAARRLRRWASSLTSVAFDWSAVTDVRRMNAWQRMGAIAGDDLGQAFGQSVEVVEGWPKHFEGKLRGASLCLSLANEQTEVRVSVVGDRAAASWLPKVLFDDSDASEGSIDDIFREMANTAAGAVKRAALIDSVHFTMGLPKNEFAAMPQGIATCCWGLALPGGKGHLAIVGEIRRRENVRVPMANLKEGMVLVHDLRNETGALLASAGTRLTTSSAQRLTQALGDHFTVEVADAA
jgi:CheY-like chemotaxis protein